MNDHVQLQIFVFRQIAGKIGRQFGGNAKKAVYELEQYATLYQRL